MTVKMFETTDLQCFNKLAELVLFDYVKQATKYLSEKSVVKATRRGKIDKRSRHVEILFTIGPPNCAEREFIKKCKKVGEPLPVKKIQIKWPKEAK